MKKEKIFSLVSAIICFATWFLPTQLFEYRFVFKNFFGMLFSGTLFSTFAWTVIDTWLFVLGCIAITALILRIFKNNIGIKLFAIISPILYVILWIIGLFSTFGAHPKILNYLLMDGNNYILWLALYFAMFFAIVILAILQFIPPRRPTKAERLQSQIDELQKQVDELKKGD